MTKLAAIIVDIDGTLACRNPEGQQVDIKGDGKYRSIHDYKRVGEDQPFLHIVELVNLLAENYEILVTTGRPESCRLETLIWLDKHLITHHSLFMRKTGDYRKDCIIKQEIYERYIEPEYDVLFALDDRDQVVRAWRDLGIPCLQVAPGAF